MAREDMDLVRDGMAAFNRRDREAWMALCHPDYETVPAVNWPESGPIRGREVAWGFYLQVDEAWEGVDPYVIDEVRDGEHGHVAVH